MICDRIKVALPEAEKQAKGHVVLTRAVKEDDPVQFGEFEGAVHAWERAGQKGDDCPYASAKAGE